jgi:hypothetical protein
VEKFDAVKDTPWPVLYRDLDCAYPNSKFILVKRDSHKWLNSAIKDFGTEDNRIHEVIYGSPYPVGNEEQWLARYERHNEEVEEYFRDRPNDLLIMSLESENFDWEPLCEFLGHEVPNMSWPKANTYAQKRRLLLRRKVAGRLKRIIGKQ